MSSTYAEPLDLVECGLDQVAAIDPTYRTTGEKQTLLVGLARIEARVQAQRLRVLAAADDIAVETGDRSTATWLANTTRRRTAPSDETQPSPGPWMSGGPRPPSRSRLAT